MTMFKSKSFYTLLLISLMLVANSIEARSDSSYENARMGDPLALYDLADSILSAKDDLVDDRWGATLFLTQSMEKGNKKAAGKIKSMYGSPGEAYTYLLKRLLRSCKENSCDSFDERGGLQAIYTHENSCATGGRDTRPPNQYENGWKLRLCIPPIDDLKQRLLASIADNALDMPPDKLAELYLEMAPESQSILSPGLQGEAADIVGNSYLEEKNFAIARFWYQRSNNQTALATLERKEKAFLAFQESKRKAEAEVLAAKENAEKKKISDETARSEAQQKAEVDRQAMEQRVALEKQSAEQKLALQRQESEKRLAEERAAGEKRLAEEKATVLAESERSRIEGLKTGSIQVTNLKDAVLKFDAKDGSQLVKQPPLSVQDGYWALRGDLRSVEIEVKGQSGNVFVCSGQYGTFAFVTDKPAERLKINQRLGIVGRHVATEPASSTNGAVVYIPIFKAVEVVDE